MLTATQEFFEPGWVLKILCPGSPPSFQYVRLLARERPILFPFRFPAGATVAAGAVSEISTVDFFPLKQNEIWQMFVGLRPGVDLYIKQPQDTTILGLDSFGPPFTFKSTSPVFSSEFDPSLTGALRALGFLNWDLSPWEDPEFYMMLNGNNKVGFTFRNSLDKAIRPEVRFILAQFTYEVIPEATLNEDMRRKATPIQIGAFLR